MSEIHELANTANMRVALNAAGALTIKEHYKVLPEESRKTLLAIIHNLSNPSVGIPIKEAHIKTLIADIAKIQDPTEFPKLKEAKNKENLLEKKIDRIFQNKFGDRVSSSKLKKAMSQIDNNKKNIYIGDHNFTVKYSAEFEGHIKKLWESVKLGELPSMAKGACASRVFTCGDTKAIFKDLSPKDLSIKRTLEIALKKLFKITRPTELLPGGAPESKGFAEKVTYDLAQKVELSSKGGPIVPETNFINKPIGPNLEGKIGSLQIYLPKTFKEAVEFFKPEHQVPTHEEKVLFQKFAIFDYLIGNLDRHAENWMVQLSESKDPNKRGRLIGIGMIDNGNSFIERNPIARAKAILKNQFQWGKHPYSIPPFTQEAKDFVNGITEEDLRAFFAAKKKELEDHPHTETFFSAAMIENTIVRLRVLKMAMNDPDYNPQKLSELKTEKAINNFLMKGK